MAAIDAAPYLDTAKCSWCKIPPGMVWYAVLAALIDVGNGDPVPTDPDEIMEQARCLQCTIPSGFVPYAILAAVSDISSGGGGSGSVLCGAADPVAAPSGSCAVYFNTATQSFWAWDGAAWVALIV